MALANSAPVNTRAVRDANFIANVALPNAANTVNTNALDLQQATPYPLTTKVLAQVIIGAGNGANNKNVNAVIQDSADNVTFANVCFLGADVAPIMRATDNNGAGLVSVSNTVLLPPGVRRYVRAQATGEANGGNAANASLTLQLLF